MTGIAFMAAAVPYLDFVKKIATTIITIKAAMGNNQEGQRQVRHTNITILVDEIHIHLTGSIRRSPNNTDTELIQALRNAYTILKELLDAISTDPITNTKVDDLTERLLHATDLMNNAIQSFQSSSGNEGICYNDLVIDTADVLFTDHEPLSANDANGHLKATCEHPTFQEISGLNQPNDVLTLDNEIFILMDGGIKAYDMKGTRVKRYENVDLKPFAAVFLNATLYVTDKKSKCIMKFDKSLNYKGSFGQDHVVNPAGITACERGKCIYVLTGRQTDSSEVAKFASNGIYERSYCSGSLVDPWYIKKSSSDEFFISDFARKVVDVYSSDFTTLNYTVKVSTHCRGMDIDNSGNIYVATREPGYNDQYEKIERHTRHTDESVVLEKSPKVWFWQSKCLQFVRGLHYYSCGDKKYLMVVDPGNKRVKIIKL